MEALALLALLWLSAGCKTTPKAPTVKEPAITWLDLEVTDLGFAEYRVRLEGEVESPEPATLQLNQYELVENGKVVKRGQLSLKEPITPGVITIFHVEEASPFSAPPDALPGPGGRVDTALVAVRGKLVLQRGGHRQELEYAQAKEVPLPRLPSIRVHELDAARYSEKELNITLRLAVLNTNPFPVSLKALDYVAWVSGRRISSGTLAHGETLDPSATAVFEVAFPITSATYGPTVSEVVRSSSVPYKVTGTLKGHTFEAPFELGGDIRLNSPK